MKSTHYYNHLLNFSWKLKRNVWMMIIMEKVEAQKKEVQVVNIHAHQQPNIKVPFFSF